MAYWHPPKAVSNEKCATVVWIAEATEAFHTARTTTVTTAPGVASGGTPAMPATPIETADYDGRRTLIVGDVNSGKTRLTQTVLGAWTAQGRSREIVVLDLAPETGRGIGGRLELPPAFQGLHLTEVLAPPRLQAESEDAAEDLAAANAAAIGPLLDQVRRAARPILVVNDVTLFLQAGEYEDLIAALEACPTALINAYYGASFPDYRLSRRERRLTERLMKACHRVIRLSR